MEGEAALTERLTQNKKFKKKQGKIGIAIVSNRDGAETAEVAPGKSSE